MFGKLKNKLKEAVGKFSKEAEESKDIKDEIIEVKETKKEKKEKKADKKEKKKKEETKEKEVEINDEEVHEEENQELTPRESEETKAEEFIEKAPEEEKQKKGFFGKIKEKVSTTQITEERFEEIFWELEISLLENDVAVEVIEKIKNDLRELLTKERIKRGSESEQILSRLEKSIEELFVEPFNLIDKTKENSPLVICMVGVNGCGKTTSMAKLGHYFTKHKKSVVFAAADTFRAAAIQQAEHHAKALNIPIISQGYGADPAAVAFDAIKYAKAKGIDVVIIDTAGRLHSNTNLMAELEKLIRVNKPDIKIFVGEAITGNDAIEQSRKFDELVNIDGIILTKADVDEKGGASISVSYVTKKPILFMGTGQTYDDLEPFNKEKILKTLFD